MPWSFSRQRLAAVSAQAMRNRFVSSSMALQIMFGVGGEHDRPSATSAALPMRRLGRVLLTTRAITAALPLLNLWAGPWST